MSAVLAGCVASGHGQRGATAVVTRRSGALRDASPTTAPPTTMAPPTTVNAVAAGDGSRQAARSSYTGVVAARAPRPAPPVWAHYDGKLTGGNYVVARAVGAHLDVSVSPDAAPVTSLSNPLPSGAPRVVTVVADQGDWLQVLLPMRPNDSLGWVRRSDVSLAAEHYRVEIDRAAHRLSLFDGSDSVIMSEPVAVGKPSTPTPTGQFFTVELLQPSNPNGAYGPYAFTLSAYSNVYQTFGSGDGAVGLHGTNEYSSVGTDASHGCVRLHNDAITRLANTLPLGTPVYIQ